MTPVVSNMSAGGFSGIPGGNGSFGVSNVEVTMCEEGSILGTILIELSIETILKCKKMLRFSSNSFVFLVLLFWRFEALKL